MGRRHERKTPSSFESERTLADAEEDQSLAADEGDARCPCGSSRFLLEGFFGVEGGRISAEPLELGSLTCPECGREFEAVQAAGGRVLRGQLLGYVAVDDD